MSASDERPILLGEILAAWEQIDAKVASVEDPERLTELRVKRDERKGTTPEKYKEASADFNIDLIKKRQAIGASHAQYEILRLRLMANQQRMKDLQELKDRVDNDIRELWCADLSENLTGTLPTMEINGEPEHMILAPQSLEPLPDTPDPLPHGMLKPMPAMTAAQAVFNWTIMPGWQKWKPTYRTGVIGSIDAAAGTASLTLDEARSYIKNFEINQGETLNAVPIDYMDCHAGAFGEGDHVVVMFADQDFNHPRVIGFVEEPKGCGFVCGMVTMHSRALDVGRVLQENITGAAIIRWDIGIGKILDTFTHPALAPSRTRYLGRYNYYVSPHSVAVNGNSAFFLIYSTESSYEHDLFGGTRRNMSKVLLCSTSPQWTLSHDRVFLTGETDSQGRPFYSGDFDDWLYVCTAASGIYIFNSKYHTDIADYSGKILRFSYSGECESEYPVPGGADWGEITYAFLNRQGVMQDIGDGRLLIAANAHDGTGRPWAYFFHTETGGLSDAVLDQTSIDSYEVRFSRYVSAGSHYIYQGRINMTGALSIIVLTPAGVAVADIDTGVPAQDGLRNLYTSQGNIYFSVLDGHIYRMSMDDGVPVVSSLQKIALTDTVWDVMGPGFPDLRDLTGHPRPVLQ